MVRRIRRRGRGGRSRRETFASVAPSVLTVFGLAAGASAIKLALSGKFAEATLAILIAAFFDWADGGAARFLKGASSFGAHLDSLADVIAFGLAPSMVLYLWQLSELGNVGWGACLFFVICAALRLARFGSRLGALPPYGQNFFQGVPTPAGGFLALCPVYLDLASAGAIKVPAEFAVMWLFLISILMVGSFPTISAKGIKVSTRLIVPGFAAIILVLLCLWNWPYASVLGLLGVYVVSFPFSYLRYRKLENAYLDEVRNNPKASASDVLDLDAGNKPNHPNSEPS